MPTARFAALTVLALSTSCAGRPPPNPPPWYNASADSGSGALAGSGANAASGAAASAASGSSGSAPPGAPTGSAPSTAVSPVLLKVARLIDGVSAQPKENQAILVVDGRIRRIGAPATLEKEAPVGTKVIDLGTATALPGLIDAHTHVLLQGDITAADYDVQLLKESIPYRTIRATMAARTALMNGFTAIRDLETEGAMYADVDVKTAIERGVIPGPRMFVATRSFAPTGMYPLSGYSWELKLPEGVQVADGPDALRKAVREQAKYGADWIKYYSDRRYYLPPERGCKHLLCSWVNYTDEEAKAIVDEAHRLGKKVAAHAIGWDGIDAALRAGADSIEHGDGLDDDLIDRMVKKKVYWCPTMYVGVYVAEGRGGVWPKMVELEKEAFKKALKKGLRIAYGTDAGGYAWTENQAKELGIMVRYGMTPMAAIQSATVVAAELLDQRANFGSIEPGRLADIIAVAGDPLKDIGELEKVSFVMKGGVVFKDERRALDK
jgi:imidazolonepropionase-like amidohydrolase